MNKYWRYILVAATLVAVTSWFTLSASAAAPRTVSGTIEKIDPASYSLTIKGPVLSKSFRIAGNATFVGTGASASSEVTLNDFKVGDKVEVTYEEHGGVLTANRITLASAVNKSQGSEQKTQPPSDQTPSEQPLPCEKTPATE